MKQTTTYLMQWYKEQNGKMDLLRSIRAELEDGVSFSAIINWMNGRAQPRKEEHIKLLAKMTGIKRDLLFKTKK